MCEGGKELGIRTFLLLQIQGNFEGTRTNVLDAKALSFYLGHR
jgi:hypothetical protein